MPVGAGATGCEVTDNNGKTHFGYREVRPERKAGLVAGVFHSVAGRYDLMNDLMSAGIHRLWKRFAIEVSAARPGCRVLDLAGGTGDMAARFAELTGPDGFTALADINDSMLRRGRDRLIDRGCPQGRIGYAQADAENLPFPENCFDIVCIAFGLRNVTNQNRALRETGRVLKPGGRLLVLEFSKPGNPLLSKAYDAYSFTVLPALGRLVAGDAESYRYLAESIRMHPDQETLKAMLADAGFSRCEYYNMTGGVVALHRGIKP